MMKRQPIVFNLDNPHQRELYEWVNGQTTNFSGFVRDVLFAYRNNRQPTTISEGYRVRTEGGNDTEYMNDLL
jgi:hypothetical protein